MFTTATVVAKDLPDPSARVHIVVEFTGDAGETPVRQDRYLDAESTQAGERAWVRDELSRLNRRVTIAAQIAVDQVIPPAATPPAPTQAELDRAAWVVLYHRYLRVKVGVDAGVIPAADAAALRQSVIDGWLAGYVAGF